MGSTLRKKEKVLYFKQNANAHKNYHRHLENRAKERIDGPKYAILETKTINDPITGDILTDPEADEFVPDIYDYTQMFGRWKQKGSELDRNEMSYIHGKEWDAKMLEALISERMKPHKQTLPRHTNRRYSL